MGPRGAACAGLACWDYCRPQGFRPALGGADSGAVIPPSAWPNAALLPITSWMAAAARTAVDPETARVCEEIPRGGDQESSVDCGDIARIPRRVTKRGSHACAPSYCHRHRPAARMAQPLDTSTSHIGFRFIFRA
ncbi:TPA: SUMF1/EgtB/PvdO family nonheme iron enzyme [Stenotrophomonas maltophilia]|nr:SUMF1/EgtB/PvdO family nonheme iron enzyme [Stenotrophomonas maltophilia]